MNDEQSDSPANNEQADKTSEETSAEPARVSDALDQSEGRVAALSDDISGLKRIEDALRASEERFRAVVNLIPDLLWESEPNGSINWFNERWTEYTGQTLDQAKGWGWKDAVHPSDLELYLNVFAETVRKQKAFHLEHRLLGHDVTYRWFVTNAFPLEDENGVVIKVYGAATDIDEQRTAHESVRVSEDRLRILIESAEDYAIFTMNLDGLIDYWNSGAERIFGYADAEILGQPTDILFTPEDRAAGIPQHEMFTAAREGRASDERWHINKQGVRFYCSGVMVPLMSDDKLRGFAKIARDLTKQKRAEVELQVAHHELEERVRQRTAELLHLNRTLEAEVTERTVAEARVHQLVQQIITAQEIERNNVARDLHDHLGQQLTGLRLKLQNHKESQPAGEKFLAQVEEIEKICAQLDEDIDFLAWELKPAALDKFGLAVILADYIQEWSKHFSTAARFHTASLGVERFSSVIEINLYRIAQEALNNVSKHAHAKAVAVLLERRDNHLQLIIEDDGRGFVPEDIVTGELNKKMGLVNMRERAAFLGGTLEIESNQQGTSIYVRVPLPGDDERN